MNEDFCRQTRHFSAAVLSGLRLLIFLRPWSGLAKIRARPLLRFASSAAGGAHLRSRLQGKATQDADKKTVQTVCNAYENSFLMQAKLHSMVSCSNYPLSHVETGQTKASLSMLLQISYAPKKTDCFLLDTPFVKKIDLSISEKLRQCNPLTLLTVSKIPAVLPEHQNLEESRL